MEHPGDDLYRHAQNSVNNIRDATRRAIPPLSPYVQEEKFYQTLRVDEPTRTAIPGGLPGGTRPDPARLGDGTKARTGSLRYAVRRIFGRRSKPEVTPQERPPQASPTSRGNYETALAAHLVRHQRPSIDTRDDTPAQRSRTRPIASMPPTEIQRTRSPYGMQFPQSARLKPLDLGNPFAQDGNQLRRRKTLPSAQTSDLDALSLAAFTPSRLGLEAATMSHGGSPAELEATAHKTRQLNRRSRSADDLRLLARESASSSPVKTEEMRQWRESFHGSVLRASGFTVQSPRNVRAGVSDDDITPVAEAVEPFASAEATRMPDVQRDWTERDFETALLPEEDQPAELEDRVAKLEASLQSFSGQLKQLSAERNRGTVMVEGVPSQAQAASGGRTASLLATDLQRDIEPSNYAYRYTNTQSSTPVRPSRTPVRAGVPSAAPAFSFNDPSGEDPFISPARARNAPGNNTTPANPFELSNGGFRFLYQLLVDERAARAKLEQQLRALRQEIADMNSQVTLVSQAQGPSDSYDAFDDAIPGSATLRTILRDTGSDLRNAAQSPQRREYSERYDVEASGMYSRFSASESDVGGTAETDVNSPYDTYVTPEEEQIRFPFIARVRNEGAMF